MNKLFSKIASLSVGLAMAAGVGLALGQQRVERVSAATVNNISHTIFSGQGASSPGSEMTATVADGKISITVAAGNSGSSYGQSFAGSSFTFKAEDSSVTAITDITITANGTSYNGSQSGGVITKSTTEGTITASGESTDIVYSGGESRTVTISHNKQIRFKTFAISYTYSESSDPEISLSTKTVNMYTTDTEEQVVTVTPNSKFTNTPVITVSGATHSSVTVDGLNVKLLPVSEGTDTLTVTATNNSEVANATLTVNVATPGKGETAGTAFTVAEARAFVDAGVGLDQIKFVKGIFYKTTTSDADIGSFKNADLWFSDDGSETTPFEAYRCKHIGGAAMTTANLPKVNDLIVVKGKLAKYNSTYELASGCELVSITTPVINAVNSVASAPSTVNVGETLNPADVKLNVSTNIGTNLVVSATSIDLDTSTAGTGIVGKAYYNSVGYAEFTINVIAVDYGGTFVLSSLVSSGENYKVISTGVLFKENIDGADTFMVDVSNSNGNLRVGAGPNVSEIMFGNKNGGASSFALSVPSGYAISKSVINAIVTDTGSAPVLTVAGLETEVDAETYTDFVSYPMTSYVLFETTSRIFVKSITLTVIEATDTNLVDAYKSAFIEATAADCTAKNVKTTTWEVVKNAFTNLNTEFESAATIIKDLDETEDMIQRYKVIIEKYGYNEFLEKGYTKSVLAPLFNLNNQNVGYVIVISIVAASAITFGLFFMLRKRKEK